jgi:hypothetical protein
MTDRNLRTFRCDAERWKAFKSKASENNTNASALLLQFIDTYLAYGCIDNGIDSKDGCTDTHIDSTDIDIDSRIDSRIDNLLQPIKQELEALRADLGEFVA